AGMAPSARTRTRATTTSASTRTRTSTRSRARARTKTYGGVSATLRHGALQGAQEGPAELQMVAPTAGVHTNFTYHGGPVINCAQVYTTFWGDQWLSDPASTQRAGR